MASSRRFQDSELPNEDRIIDIDSQYHRVASMSFLIIHIGSPNYLPPWEYALELFLCVRSHAHSSATLLGVPYSHAHSSAQTVSVQNVRPLVLRETSDRRNIPYVSNVKQSEVTILSKVTVIYYPCDVSLSDRSYVRYCGCT